MVDQLAIEKKWQAFWQENNTFVAKPNSKPKYFGTVPYPYANSALHIGHGRTFTAADVMLRYHRLKGENVLYPLAFHISGTPVLAVADGISHGDKKTTRLAKDAVACYIFDDKKTNEIVSSFTDVQVIADFFSSKIEDTLASVGLGMDYSRVFSTGDAGYQHFVQWQYKELEKSGILTQGKYPILFSPVDDSAVGEDDIKDGDLEKVTVQEMIYILFKEKNEDIYFCVATLRPDALFGTTNLWVDPTHDIIKVQVDEQVWYVNKAILSKLQNQFDTVKVLDELKGKNILGKTFITPIINREVPIASALFIDAKHGTGLVYSSPAGSPHDYMGLLEAKADGRIDSSINIIETVNTKDKKGNIISWEGECAADHMRKKYGIIKADDPKLEDAKQELYKLEHYGGVLNDKCGSLEGVPIKYAKDKVTQVLKDAKLGGILYDTSRRAVTRAGNDVIVANLQGQWFLDYSSPEVKTKATNLLSNMSFYPTNLRGTQQGYLDWVQKRPCARKRGIGTKLPQDTDWIIEPLSDSTIYPLYYVIAGFINDGRLLPEQINDDLLNYFYKGGKSPSIDGIEELKKEVNYWSNFDFRYTAPPHLSNHLSFLIYHNALLFTPEFQPKNITVGGLLIKDGQKISKSKGNGLPLIKVRETYGADLYRLYVVVGTSYDSEFDFRDEEILQLEKKFNKWKEYLFLSKEQKELQSEELIAVDKWLISRFYTRSKEYFQSMEEMKSRDAYISILYEFLSELNYHSRRTSEERTSKVIRSFFQDYIKIMTPVVPHICEELYQGEGTGAVSLANFTTKFDDYINKDIEDVEEITQELLRLISYHKDKRNLSSLQKIIIVQAKDNKFKLFDRLKEILNETKEFKKILPQLMQEFDDKKFIMKFVPKTLGSGLQPYLPKEEEKKYLESVQEFISEEFDCEVNIKNSDTFETKQQALPGSPGIIIE